MRIQRVRECVDVAQQVAQRNQHSHRLAAWCATFPRRCTLPRALEAEESQWLHITWLLCEAFYKACVAPALRLRCACVAPALLNIIHSRGASLYTAESDKKTRLCALVESNMVQTDWSATRAQFLCAMDSRPVDGTALPPNWRRPRHKCLEYHKSRRKDHEHAFLCYGQGARRLHHGCR
jgi:hypothetical protein